MTSERDRDPADLQRRAAETAVTSPEASGGSQEQDAEAHQQQQPAQTRVEEVRAVLERDRPDPVERVLSRLGDAEAGPQRVEQPDDQRGDLPVSAVGPLIWSR